jgi:hypothetical protein
MSARKAKDSATRGIIGPAIGDVALGNVSTTERHAQRSDIMDTLRPLQRIGDLGRYQSLRGPRVGLGHLAPWVPSSWKVRRLGAGELRQPHRIATSPGFGWFPTANPQTKRDYAVLDGTADGMNESLLASANAGKNGQRCFAGSWFRADRTPEKRKVGGSTPPLTTTISAR